MFKVIGIDEAGKGPAIGSLFIAFSIIVLEDGEKSLEDYNKKLVSLGVKDSKELNPKKRNFIYQQLKTNLDMKYAQLTPHLIDSNNKIGGSLNKLEIDAIIQILNTEKPNLIIVDALTSDPKKFSNQIKEKLSFDCRIIAENKADQTYPMVSAASIIAKELREQEVAQIKENIKLDCGSGYSSDPKTKEFIAKHWNSKEFDFIFRKSWETYKRLVRESNQKTLDEF